MSRVVVTGLGVVSAAGVGADATARWLQDGSSGIGELTLFESPRNGRFPVAQAQDVTLQEAEPRAVGLARVAVEEALASAGLSGDPRRVGLCLGCTVGGMPESEPAVRRLLGGEDVDPTVWLRHEVGYTTAALARAAGLTGPTLTVSTACASGAQAIADGVELLQAGFADVIVAGGADALCRLTLNGFASLLLIDPDGCRPFDAERSGMSLGEGAAFLVLERAGDAAARGAPVLAELAGWANTCDAHHPTAPDPAGRGAEQVVRGALAAAGLRPAEVDHVSAHGTGTKDNDRVEGQVLARVFEDTPVHVASTKRAFGHTLGAAGAIEAASSVLGIARGFVPGNPGLTTPDPECEIEPLRESASEGPRVVLSTSFGFGGNNTALVLTAPDREGPGGTSGLPAPLLVTGYAVSGAQVELPVGREVAAPPAGFHKRRARVPSWAANLAKAAAPDFDLPETTGVFLGTAYGSLTETEAFVEHMIREREEAPKPRAFSASVHNAAAGQIARALGARGENQTFVHGELSFALTLFAAGRRRTRGDVAPAVIGALDEVTDYVRRGVAACAPPTEPSEGGALLVSDDGRPALATLSLLALGLGEPRAWLAEQDHGADALWVPDAGWGVAGASCYTPWTGNHPARGAVAAGLAVGLACGELAPEALGLTTRPGSVALALASRFGELALLKVAPA